LATLYVSAPGAQFDDEGAQILGTTFEKIQEEEPLTATAVVEHARSETSPIHGFFEWDDAIAGLKFRITQARHYLNHIRVIPAPKKDPIRAFHVVTHVDHNKKEYQAYTPLATVISHPEMMKEVIANARKELEGWRQRYNQYKDLHTAVVEIDKIILSLKESTEENRGQ